MKNIFLKSFIFLCFFVPIDFLAHTVQIQYCVNCNGNLRIWLEHWHNAQDPNITTMDISVTINGVTTLQMSAPGGGVQNMVPGQLPGCSTPIIYAGGCQDHEVTVGTGENTHNDWVFYDFTGLPQGVPISFTIISGNTVFTEDGCNMFPLTVDFTINAPIPVADQNICDGGPSTAVAMADWTNSNPAIGLPAFGAGNIPVFTPIGGPGTTATINYTNASGCDGSFVYTVIPAPAPAYTVSSGGVATSTICLGSTFDFSNSSTIVAPYVITDYLWGFGDGNTSTATNPSYTYAADGTYDVTLSATSNSGCIMITTQQVVVGPLPVVFFTSDVVCENTITSFTDMSTGVNSWQWDFTNDGIVDDVTQNPTFLFPNAGTYNTKLIVTSADGCSSTLIQQVIVNTTPIGHMLAIDTCVGLEVPFIYVNTSGELISQYSWSFGDGGTSPLETPSYTYQAPSSYQVDVTVLSYLGCSFDTLITITADPYPVAQFLVEDVCLYDSIYCNNLSSITTGNIDSYTWGFGDGQSSTTENPYHNYHNYGVYEVQLIVSALGCTDTLQQNVQIHEPPIVEFSVNNACLQNISAFNNTSTINTGNISSYQWNFGNGIASVLETPVHTYTINGDYDVSLVAISNFGCTDTSIHTTTIYPLPEPNFEVANVCLENEVQFLNTSIISSGGIVSYTWDFDNGVNSLLEEPVYAYLAKNIYNVTLTAYSNEGCENETILPVEIYPLPIADFESSKVCNLNETSFTEQAMVSNINTPNNIAFWGWDFGDGVGNSNLPFPGYIYAAPGSYLAKLVVETNHGCLDSIEKVVVVYPNPEILFQLSDSSGCSPLCVSFRNTSSILSGVITSFSWDFGDNNFSAETLPTNCYLNDEFNSLYHDVELTATSDKGCISTLIESAIVEVFPLPIAQYTIEDNKLMQVMNETTHFTNESVDAFLWEWSFGDGAIDTIEYNPSHTYPVYGNYQTELIVYNIYGCSDTASHPLDVRPEYSIFAPNAFTPNNDGKNDKFSLKGLNIEEVELLIYDRWGNLVFQEASNNPKWNGTGKNNEIAKQDTYVWKANVKFVEKMIKESFVGHVTLVK